MKLYASVIDLFRRRKFYMKLLAYLLLLAIIPNMALSMMSYANATKTFRKEAA